MEFLEVGCRCGFKFSGEVPKDAEIIELKESYNIHGREVEFVAPCPSCGKNVPVWEPPEPTEPEAETKPEPET